MSKLVKMVAVVVAAMMVSGAAIAEEFPSLVPMPAPALKNKTDVIEVRNMPEVISQGGLPICAGAAAWALYMQHQCRKNNSDCRNLDPAKTPSILGVAGVGIDAKSYQRLKSVKLIPYHSSSRDHKSLDAILGLDDMRSEACYPYQQLVYQKFDGDNKKFVAAFRKIEQKYFNKYKTEGGICMDCLLRDLRDELWVTTDQETATAGLQEDVFDKFLYDVILKNCQIKVPLDEYKMVLWPPSEEKYSYQGFISHIKENVSKNQPLSSSFCCLEKSTGDQACKGHTFVITGYSKVCDSGGRKCKDYIKVHNSWGLKWQSEHSDGWIDAQNYYEYMAKDEPMTWLIGLQANAKK